MSAGKQLGFIPGNGLAKGEGPEPVGKLRFVNEHQCDERIPRNQMGVQMLSECCEAQVKVKDSCVGNSHPGKA